MASEIAIGGTPAPGFVVGGVFTTMVYPKVGGTSGDSFLAGQIGPFIDYYPIPTKGLHFLGAAGFGPMAFTGFPTTWVGFSWGGMVEAGYEFWVDKQMSFGAAARFGYAAGAVTPPDPFPRLPMNISGMFTGALLLFTYH
jgi:hypothetical protein